MLLILKIWVWFMDKNKLTLNFMKKIWEETSYLEGMGRKKVYANRLVSFCAVRLQVNEPVIRHKK